LAGAAAGVAVIAPAFGWDCETRKSWLGAVQSDGMRERTTALSATLLELASRGQVMEPVGSLLEFVQGHGRWKVAGQKLLGIGHSTGRAYAAALGATMVLLPGDHGRCSL